MNYSNIKWNDIANGPGVRVSLFVSGCKHYCKGCFNKDTWDFNYGQVFTNEIEDKIIKAINNKNIRGLSLLGGEPFENVSGLFKLLLKFNQSCPDKTVWCWTGFTFEQMVTDPEKRAMLNYIDVLVDGKFVEELKDIRLKHAGSSNQRVIDVKKSIVENKIILYTE
jgi:anaerobic ribonucleoside-triphosphate reductase activating protein